MGGEEGLALGLAPRSFSAVRPVLHHLADRKLIFAS